MNYAIEKLQEELKELEQHIRWAQKNGNTAERAIKMYEDINIALLILNSSCEQSNEEETNESLSFMIIMQKDGTEFIMCDGKSFTFEEFEKYRKQKPGDE